MLIEQQVVKRLVWIVVIHGVLNTIANMLVARNVCISENQGYKATHND